MHTREILRGGSEATLREYKELDEKAIEALKADIEELLVDEEETRPCNPYNIVTVPLHNEYVKPVNQDPTKITAPSISPYDSLYPYTTCDLTKVSKTNNVIATATKIEGKQNPDITLN